MRALLKTAEGSIMQRVWAAGKNTVDGVKQKAGEAASKGILPKAVDKKKHDEVQARHTNEKRKRKRLEQAAGHLKDKLQTERESTSWGDVGKGALIGGGALAAGYGAKKLYDHHKKKKKQPNKKTQS